MTHYTSSQDGEKNISPMDAKKTQDSVKGGKKFLRFLLLHSQMFHQPVEYWKGRSPIEYIRKEFISMILTLLIPVGAAFIGGMALVWRPYQQKKYDTVFTSHYFNNGLILLLAFSIIGIPILVYILSTNFRNRETSKIHTIFYSLRLWMGQYIPFIIGFILIFWATVIETQWNIERLTLYYFVIIHFALVWQCIIFASYIYAQSDDRKKAIMMGVGIFIAIILAEQILAMILNDRLIENWTLMDLWRGYLRWGMFK